MTIDDTDRDGQPEGFRESSDDAPLERTLRERRLKVRCWRRGTKEMDLILGGFFDREIRSLSDEELAEFEALICEDDGALYRWVSGAEAPPQAHAGIVERIRKAQDGFWNPRKKV